ncbi:MAG: NAD(P)H-hydrate dehydratase [Nitrospiria bacterium]
MKVVSAKEMQRLEQLTIQEYGIPALLLMENASQKTFFRLKALFGPLKNKPILIVAGEGNNGGDGLALGRHLFQAGYNPAVYLVSKDLSLKNEAKVNHDIFKKIGGRIFYGSDKQDVLDSLIQDSDILVDAIFGTGLNRSVEGRILDIIQKINASRKKVVALDISSGVSADSGALLGGAVNAHVTLTYGVPKRGHFLFPGASFRGQLYVEEIGIPAALIEKESLKTELLDTPFIQKIFPKKRPQNSHKGTFGHLLVIAGSRGKRGAGALCCKAALRSGAGLVTWALPDHLNLPDAFVPEVMTLPLPETAEGTLSLASEKALLSCAKKKDAVAIGPGLSTHPETWELIKRLLPQLDCPVILDADAVTLLAEEKDLLKRVHGPVLMTPHPGEFAKFLGIETTAVQQERAFLVSETASQYGCTIVLKGAYSLIADRNRSIWINPTGNPGMATAGTGDVLTGIIAGFCAQGHQIPEAAQIGVFLHGLSGDLALEEKGEISLIASDIIEKIPSAIQHLMARQNLI